MFDKNQDMDDTSFMKTQEQTTEAYNARWTINALLAPLYAHLPANEACKAAHENMDCIGECVHCEAEGVKTWHQGNVSWRLAASIKGVIFPVFQEWVSDYADTFIHASRIGAWVAKAPFMVWNKGGESFTECWYDRESGRVVGIGSQYQRTINFKYRQA